MVLIQKIWLNGDIDKYGMKYQLDKINSKFRNLTDLLFFSNQLDIDLSKYKELYKLSHKDHNLYILDRFEKCSEIFWENNVQFWTHRLEIILSLNDKSLNKDIDSFLEKRFFCLIRTKKNVNIKYDNELCQFVALCSVKRKYNLSLLNIKNYLVDMSAHVCADTLINVINSLIPIVYSDINEYINLLSKRITQSSSNFTIIKALEDRGVIINKKIMVSLLKDLLTKKLSVSKNRNAIFALLSDKEILSQFKSEKSRYKPNLIAMLSHCSFFEIEGNHLQNIKILLDLDKSLANDISSIYIDKLYQRTRAHKKANADKIIRLLKTFTVFNPKKVLAQLSHLNKMSDIKYMIQEYPELKNLAAFV